MRALKLVMIFMAAGCLSSCAQTFYKQTSDSQLDQVKQGNLPAAIAVNDSDDILGDMQTGILQRMSQNYDESNKRFADAQAQIQVWASSWKNTTTGRAASNLSSLLLSDNIHDYEPKGFEKSFLATYYALNQLGLSSLDNARVEITQMYEIEEATENYNQALYNAERQETQQQRNNNRDSGDLYTSIQNKYNFPDINSPAVLALRNSYQSAFSHYLAGFVFEALNEPSLSRPGYVQAGQLSPQTTLIQRSIDNVDNGVKPKPGYTDLLLVEGVGHAPQIQSQSVVLPVSIGHDSGGNPCSEPVTLFYPKLIYDHDESLVYPYAIDGKSMMPVTLTNVDLMAARAVHDDLSHIILQNFVAAVRDVAIARAACIQQGKQGQQNQGMALGLGGIVLGTFLNRVDERAWVLLPRNINVTRLPLKYGPHTLSINIHGKIYNLIFSLNQPYQVLAFRVLGDQVYFEPQISMGAKK